MKVHNFDFKYSLFGFKDERGIILGCRGFPDRTVQAPKMGLRGRILLNPLWRSGPGTRQRVVNRLFSLGAVFLYDRG